MRPSCLQGQQPSAQKTGDGTIVGGRKGQQRVDDAENEEKGTVLKNLGALQFECS